MRSVRSWCRPALFFLVGMVLVLAGADDPDAQKRSVDSALSQLREDLHDTEAGLAAAYLALKETEAKIPGAQAALTAAEGQLAAARRCPGRSRPQTCPGEREEGRGPTGRHQ
ncbi:exported hypothetical protein [Phycicoccus elongatus Lp2]|uniref:Uncharacterized protein n=1 Tax=Phycicoccus elongatus Lp2 TaxID=1193181 RepID=N0E1V1_9MICO|nr:hypothetical protein [Phycicoccus elongatus]CCH68894.1 exported hypothetical protein [Phycicoccus elongatus Lp2]